MNESGLNRYKFIPLQGFTSKLFTLIPTSSSAKSSVLTFAQLENFKNIIHFFTEKSRNGSFRSEHMLVICLVSCPVDFTSVSWETNVFCINDVFVIFWMILIILHDSTISYAILLQHSTAKT